MLIEQNPFYILEVSTKDTKQTILDKAEEKALFEDPETIEQAKEALLDSGKRLDAELGWFVYASQEEELLLLDLLHGRNAGGTPVEFHDEYDRANYQMEVIAKRNYARLSKDTFGKNIVDILKILEIEFDPEAFEYSELPSEINENREQAGMPGVDEAEVLDHLYQRREVIIDAIKRKMNTLEVDQLLASVHLIADEMTKHGEERASELVESLLAMYEMETKQFADRQAERIEQSISFSQKAEDAPEENKKHILSQAMNEIVAGMRNWQRVMEPLQMLAMSKGREHEPTVDLWHQIRGVSLAMNNRFHDPQLALQLTLSMRDLHVHKYVPSLRRGWKDDSVSLEFVIDDMHKAMEQQRKDEEEHRKWAESIYYHAELGTVISDPFEISEHGIFYQGKRIPLEDVVGVKWGGISKSVNFIPAGTDYRISYQSKAETVNVTPSNEAEFKGIVEHLWNAVGMRLIFDTLLHTKNGESIQVGGIAFYDKGVWLHRQGLFHSGEKLFSWKAGLSIYAKDGELWVAAEQGKYAAHASYLDDMNTHIIERVMIAAVKNHCGQLSDLLK